MNRVIGQMFEMIVGIKNYNRIENLESLAILAIVLDKRQLALKVTANSFFGFFKY